MAFTDKIGSFVIQKGYPNKAKSVAYRKSFSPLEWEVDFYVEEVCHPVMPIQPMPQSHGELGSVPLILGQPVQCTGYISAWRFYAQNIGDVSNFY